MSTKNPLTRAKKRKALALLQHHQPAEAVPLLEQVCQTDQLDSRLWFLLAAAYQELGAFAKAADTYRHVIEIEHGHIDAHYYLGNTCLALGDSPGAVTAFQETIRLRPDHFQARFNLGALYELQKNFAAAEECFRDALRLEPQNPELHYNLGNVYQTLGQYEEAINSYRNAIELKPGFIQSYNNLGLVLEQVGRLEEAIASYQRALAIRPDFVEAHSNMGVALNGLGRLEEAAACYRRALAIRPNDAETFNNLGNVLTLQGRLDEAISSYQKALTIRPDYATAHSNMLFAQLHLPDIALTRIIESHKEWAAVHASHHRASWKKFDNNRDPERRLVLGFCSGDFRRHPVGYFIIRVFESLRAENCDIVCYSTHTGCDDLTVRFKATATKWRDAHHLSDDQLCEIIRQDRVDILFDLTGHNAKSRLLAFARKPAPLSITWAGYMATTGLDAIDYILADRFEIPEGTERFYVEKVIRMPAVFVCYDPPEYAPEVSSLPALASGHITFGSLNRLNKLNTEVITTWAEILRRIAGSKLILKTKELSCPHTRDRVASTFRQHGIDSSRVDFHGGSSHKQHMLAYNSIDIQLDTFPYTGSTTTLESLWMGVPVIALPNETFAGRHSLTFLSNIGLTEVIARDAGHYIDLAVSLAGDLTRLTELRAGLRSRLAQSPACDGPRFARSLMAELRTAWREWCRSAIAAPASPSTSVSETDDK